MKAIEHIDAARASLSYVRIVAGPKRGEVADIMTRLLELRASFVERMHATRARKLASERARDRGARKRIAARARAAAEILDAWRARESGG